jgi:hypothetical protein
LVDHARGNEARRTKGAGLLREEEQRASYSFGRRLA